MTLSRLFVFTFSTCLSVHAFAETSYTRDQIEKLARSSSKAIMAARDHVDIARAAVDTAAAFPNPELQYQQGSARARTLGAAGVGDVRTMTLTQPLDLPGRRGARIETAEAGLQAATASSRAMEAEIMARVRLRYFELLRRQAELKASKEDQELMDSIHTRIALRVETGEAPRYELVKADAELLNSLKNTLAAELRARQSRAALRAIVGPQLAEDFVLSESIEEPLSLVEHPLVREEIRKNNPELNQARAEKLRAQKQLEYERAQRWPSVSLVASRDNEPELNTSRVGVAITIPIWDRRSGPVAEATANLARAGHQLEYQEFAVDRGLEVAYEQYQIAEAQVTALESGIVRQARNALQIAEAAYRFGERGILEVLDAQRVYRAARSELISARYELAAAWTEIERLRASQP